MLKLVLDDYKHGFNQGIINASRAGWVIYVYVLVAVPLTFHLNLTGILIFSCSMVPMLLVLMISRMYANVMHKTLLLCPLSKQEKKSILIRHLLSGQSFHADCFYCWMVF